MDNLMKIHSIVSIVSIPMDSNSVTHKKKINDESVFN